MKADPFAFDDSEPTDLKDSDLEEIFKRYGGRKKKKVEKKAEKKMETKAEKNAP